MANNLTDIEEVRLLDLSLGTVFIGLFTATPGEAGGGTEVTGNAYARQSIPFAAAATATNNTTKANSGTVTFPAATPAGWGTVTHFAIFDAATAGNMRWYGPLTSSQAVGVGGVVTIAAGAIVAGLD